MVGERVKELREARAWTQAHLAEAADLSLRTVQRLERGHSGSAETLMALAAAFGVEVSELSEQAALPRAGWLYRTPAVARAAWGGLLLALPALLFVAFNLLKFEAGIGQPYDAAAKLGTTLGLGRAFGLLSPVLFVGGPAAALVLGLAASVRPQGEVRGAAITLTSVEVRLHWGVAAVLAVSAVTLAILLAYLAGENLAELARARA